MPGTTTHDSPMSSMAERWESCGPLFTTEWNNSGDVDLRYRYITVANINGDKFTVMHLADSDTDRTDFGAFVSSFSHLDIIMRKWTEAYSESGYRIRLAYAGTTYVQVLLTDMEPSYTLITNNGRAPQVTSHISDLARYTEWIVHSVESRETSHTELFIDSMRRL